YTPFSTRSPLNSAHRIHPAQPANNGLGKPIACKLSISADQRSACNLLDDSSGSGSIGGGVFQEAQHRESASERRAFSGTCAAPNAHGSLFRIRVRTYRSGTGAAARNGDAPRSRRTTPAFAGHGRILRPDFSLRQTRNGTAA